MQMTQRWIDQVISQDHGKTGSVRDEPVYVVTFIFLWQKNLKILEITT